MQNLTARGEPGAGEAERVLLLPQRGEGSRELIAAQGHAQLDQQRCIPEYRRVLATKSLVGRYNKVSFVPYSLPPHSLGTLLLKHTDVMAPVQDCRESQQDLVRPCLSL
jgi:hypothetical protein